MQVEGFCSWRLDVVFWLCVPSEVFELPRLLVDRYVMKRRMVMRHVLDAGKDITHVFFKHFSAPAPNKGMMYL
jgi:capsid protein